jgi:hypothetical protein
LSFLTGLLDLPFIIDTSKLIQKSIDLGGEDLFSNDV